MFLVKIKIIKSKNNILLKSPYDEGNMFGRKINNFEDWTTQHLDNEVGELMQRAKELENLSTNGHQTALARISDAQEIQKTIQNKRNVTVMENLPMGAQVFVKNEGIIGKLEARYSGPYKIERVTSRGNYELFDSKGSKFIMSCRRHKLKVVKDTFDLTAESFEIKKTYITKNFKNIQIDKDEDD